MKKIRVLSFFLVCFILFLFLTFLPSLHAPESPTTQDSSPKTLMLDSTIRQKPSQVIVMKTPIQRTPAQPNSDAAVTNVPVYAESPVSQETIPNPMKPMENQKKAEEEIQQGGYPDSKLWEHETSGSVIPQNSNVSPTTFSTSEELFTEHFLYENPMVEKGNPGNSFTQISQNAGLDIIPREAGINGRSIYGLREHSIEDGDTLERIATRYLYDSARANEIFELNREILPSKDELPIGAVLRIPDRK